ncbi:MAG TPA: hypothetical protein VGM74_17015 [Burkholderiaceae bacterium]
MAPYPPQRVVYAQPVPAPLPAPVQYQSDVQPVPSYEAEAPLVVDVAPPPPMVEVVPALPFAGALWIGGYWGWSGGRHQWIGGHYERPRPGYAWRPHAWVNVGGRWHSQGGGWVRR